MYGNIKKTFIDVKNKNQMLIADGETLAKKKTDDSHSAKISPKNI